MDNMPLFFENYVLKENAKTIMDYINNHQDDWGDLKEGRENYWTGRSIHFDRIKDEQILKILRDYREELFKKFYELSGVTRTIYNDILSLTRWPIGYELQPHADAEEPDGRPHPFPWRNFGTVGFLNEDFEGGELYLPNQNITIKAKAGYSAVFPGTVEYLHGVTKITSGCRYTIASFLTYDENHQMNF